MPYLNALEVSIKHITKRYTNVCYSSLTHAIPECLRGKYQTHYKALYKCLFMLLTLLAAWSSGRALVFGQRAFAVLRSTCSWWVTTYVGKPSAIGQPTRPTQPFILSGSISGKLQLDVCCLSCCGGDIWWTLTKEKQAWCCLQVKLCDPRLSTLCVPWCKKALYKYSSFPLLLLSV